MYLHRVNDDCDDTSYAFSSDYKPKIEDFAAYELPVIYCELRRDYVSVQDRDHVVSEPFHNCYDLGQWVRPDSYGGFMPVGHFFIFSRSRDSSILENSNYERILEDLKGKFGEYVYDYRARCWAVGWVEEILMLPDAPEKAQKAVYEVLSGLDNYPVYDESDYSDRLEEEAERYWDRESLRGKVEICDEVGASIFQARCEWWELDNDAVRDRVREYVGG